MHIKKDEQQITDDRETAEAVVVLPIDGALDLHTFSPADVRELVPDYLWECLKKNILEVRIIHGKGEGVLRRIVHSALERLDFVESWRLAGHDRGGWGATIVYLKKVSGDAIPK